MSTIFDLIDEDSSNISSVPQGNSNSKPKASEDIFDLAIQQNVQPPKADQPWYESVPKDALKGFVEGLARLGQTMNPTLPEPGKKPFSMEEFTQQWDEILPSTETPVGGALRKALNIAPSATTNPLAAPSNALAQSGIAGLLGQGVKEAGGGETMQTIAEIIPFLFGGKAGAGGVTEKSTKARDILSQQKGIPKSIRNIMAKSSANQQEVNELINFAQKEGLTAKELTPLIQGQTKQLVLSKLADKGDRTQKALEASKSSIGNIMNRFRTGETGAQKLNARQSNKMIGEMQDILYDLPAKSRNAIMEDFNQLASSDKSVNSIVKFYRDINASGNKLLSRLKEPIRKSFQELDPKLAKDFDLTNKLYMKQIDIANKLKPSLADKILTASTVPKVSFGIATGNFPLIAESVGEVAARKFASEMLTNPKFQNTSRKLINALNKGQFAIADRIRDEYIRMTKKDYPEISSEMQKETYKEFVEE